MISEVDIILYIMYKGMVRKMNLTMKASDFDQEGLYSAEEGGKICFLGLLLDIPDFVTHSQEEELEEVLLKGAVRIGDCFQCHKRTTTDTIIFGTDHYRMLILRCCDHVIWTTEEYLKEIREDTGWKESSEGV